MTSEDPFCPECGNPRGGIICSSCNTLNFRSFCRKCNTPLNALAQEALEDARKDVRLKKAIEIAQELENLEEIIQQFGDEDENIAPQLSEENKKIVEQYKDLMAFVGGEKKIETPPTTETKSPQS